MEDLKLDLLTNEAMSNFDIVGILNNNSTHLTNHIGKNYTTWHFEELQTVLDIITSLQENRLSYRFWKDESLFIIDGDEWE